MKHADVIETTTLDAAAVPNYLDSMPNEVLIEIIRHLSLVDRKSIGKISDRFKGLEQMSDNRRFIDVFFDAKSRFKMSVYDKEMWREVKVEEQEQFFKRAKTHRLTVKNLCSNEDRGRLLAACSTLHFDILDIGLPKRNSHRILSELVRGRKHIDTVVIWWWSDEMYVRQAREALQTIPPIRNFTIMHCEHPLIDDDTFLHLVGNCSNSTDLGKVEETEITSRGLARAFEMVCASSASKVVKCTILSGELHQWRNQLEESKFNELSIPGTELRSTQHLDSGAFIEYEVDNDVDTMVDVTMCTADHPASYTSYELGCLQFPRHAARAV